MLNILWAVAIKYGNLNFIDMLEMIVFVKQPYLLCTQQVKVGTWVN